MDKKKRERAVNFTELEVRFLVDIAIRHIKRIENKHTDAVTWREKNQAWMDIATEFNAVTGYLNRSAKVLRLKYDGIKRNIKNKVSKNKLEIFKTGGGSAETNPLADYEEKLMGYISLSVEGLPTENDSDNVFPAPTCSSFERMDEEPAILNTQVAEYVVDNSTGELFSQEEEVPLFMVEEHNYVAEASSPSSSKWKTWNPRQLKEKKHSSLLSTPKKINKDSLNKKIDLLTDSRTELTNLQSQIAEQELQKKQQYLELQQKCLENEEHRKSQQHNQLMVNLNLQHQLLLDTQDRQKTESALKEELLRLEIQNKKLEILLTQKRLQ